MSVSTSSGVGRCAKFAREWVLCGGTIALLNFLSILLGLRWEPTGRTSRSDSVARARRMSTTFAVIFTTIDPNSRTRTSGALRGTVLTNIATGPVKSQLFHLVLRCMGRGGRVSIGE